MAGFDSKGNYHGSNPEYDVDSVSKRFSQFVEEFAKSQEEENKKAEAKRMANLRRYNEEVEREERRAQRELKERRKKEHDDELEAIKTLNSSCTEYFDKMVESVSTDIESLVEKNEEYFNKIDEYTEHGSKELTRRQRKEIEELADNTQDMYDKILEAMREFPEEFSGELGDLLRASLDTSSKYRGAGDKMAGSRNGMSTEEVLSELGNSIIPGFSNFMKVGLDNLPQVAAIAVASKAISATVAAFKKEWQDQTKIISDAALEFHESRAESVQRLEEVLGAAKEIGANLKDKDVEAALVTYGNEFFLPASSRELAMLTAVSRNTGESTNSIASMLKTLKSLGYSEEESLNYLTNLDVLSSMGADIKEILKTQMDYSRYLSGSNLTQMQNAQAFLESNGLWNNDVSDIFSAIARGDVVGLGDTKAIYGGQGFDTAVQAAQSGNIDARDLINIVSSIYSNGSSNRMVQNATGIYSGDIARAQGLQGKYNEYLSGMDNYNGLKINNSLWTDTTDYLSNEATQAVIDVKSIPGDVVKLFDGSHRSGINSIPYDGYVAELHRDERVLTANEAHNEDESVKKLTMVVDTLTKGFEYLGRKLDNVELKITQEVNESSKVSQTSRVR